MHNPAAYFFSRIEADTMAQHQDKEQQRQSLNGKGHSNCS